MRRPGRIETDHRPGSLLGRIVATFVVVLTLSATLVGLFETSRNRAALRDQSEALLENELGILRTTMLDQLANQRGIIGGLARDLATSAALRTRDELEIRRMVSPSVDSRVFDHLGVVARDGYRFVVTGEEIPDLAWDAVDEAVTGLLLSDAAGEPVLLVSEVVDPDTVLVGGIRIGDAWAYRMRSLVLGEVFVVVDGELAGATMPRALERPPGWDSGPPESALSVEVAGEPTLVDYQQLARPQGGFGRTAHVGVVNPDLLGELDAALVRDRLLALALLATVGLVLALVLFRLVLRPVTELTDAARRIAEGELEHDFAGVPASGELRDLAAALDRMVARLQDNTAVIGQQAGELRRATERLVQARDDERRRVAATLHDAFQQRLVVLRMRLRAIQQDTAPDVIDSLADDVLALLTDLRRLSHDLYPSILRDRGLGSALHSLVSGTDGDIRVQLEPDPLPRVPLETEANAYFLVAEGLTNALKHAPGAPVVITVRLYDEELEVCVIDAGPGFDVRTSRGAGLTGFEDRAAAVGGTCYLTSDENGTWIVARLPVPPDPDRPSTGRYVRDATWAALQQLRDIINARKAVGLPPEGPDPDWFDPEAVMAMLASAALQEEQDGGDPSVEVGGIGQAEL